MSWPESYYAAIAPLKADDEQRLRDSGRLRAPRDPERQHDRLGGEPRIDAGYRVQFTSSGYDGQTTVWMEPWWFYANPDPRKRLGQWEREVSEDELRRWCGRKWDRQTAAIAEARDRKAARPETPV